MTSLAERSLRALRRAGWLLFVAVAMCTPLAAAHEFKLDAVVNAFVKVDRTEATIVVRAPLYLFKSARFPIRNIEIDLDASGPAVQRAIAGIEHDVTLFENGRALTASSATGRLSLPSDRSFETYDEAVAHVAQPVEHDTQIYVDQGYVDARITYPITSPDAVFALRTIAGRELGEYLKVPLRFIPAEGESRALVITSTSGVVDLNPSWVGAAAGFVGLGISHILTGYDHLLFLLCLVVPLRGWRQILSVVTIFTIAHSFTLIGSAFRIAPSGAWFPPFVETAIAASIVYMAIENIVGVRLERRVLVTGLFGLVHGFGFSYGLQENFQFAGSHLVVSLLGFNVGIELGQMLVLAVMLPTLALLRRHLLRRRIGVVILSAFIAHTGWHWMLDRADALWRAPWPRPGATGVTVLAAWLVGLVIAAGCVGFVLRRSRSVRPLASSLSGAPGPRDPAARGAAARSGDTAAQRTHADQTTRATASRFVRRRV